MRQGIIWLCIHGIFFSLCPLKFLLLNQGASRAAPGKSGLHARGEGERVLALESREGTRASRRVDSGSAYSNGLGLGHLPASWCAWTPSPGVGDFPIPSGEPGVSGDFWGSQEGCQHKQHMGPLHKFTSDFYP